MAVAGGRLWAADKCTARGAEDPDLQHRYARAREDQAERNAEQLVALSDELNRPGVTMEEIQVAKLRIDVRRRPGAP